MPAPLHTTSLQVGYNELEHIIGELGWDHTTDGVDGWVDAGTVLEDWDGVEAEGKGEHRHKGAGASGLLALDVWKE